MLKPQTSITYVLLRADDERLGGGRAGPPLARIVGERGQALRGEDPPPVRGATFRQQPREAQARGVGAQHVEACARKRKKKKKKI